MNNYILPKEETHNASEFDFSPIEGGQLPRTSTPEPKRKFKFSEDFRYNECMQDIQQNLTELKLRGVKNCPKGILSGHLSNNRSNEESRAIPTYMKSLETMPNLYKIRADEDHNNPPGYDNNLYVLNDAAVFNCFINQHYQYGYLMQQRAFHFGH